MIDARQLRYRAATWSSRHCQIRSDLPLLSHLSGALCWVGRGYRFGREENPKEMACLVADAGAPDEALSAMPGIDLEPFGTLSGSQSRPSISQACAMVRCGQYLCVRVLMRVPTTSCRLSLLYPVVRFPTAPHLRFISPSDARTGRYLVCKYVRIPPLPCLSRFQIHLDMQRGR